jgi:hypothetical protein
MGSSERSGRPLKGRDAAIAVLVSLDALFPAAEHPPTGDGLQLRGWAAGALHRWLRSADGSWVGVCTVLIQRTDGSIYKAVDHLVPAQALRPR